MPHGLDLEKLTIEELQALVTDAQKALADKATAKRNELLEQLAKLDGMTGKAPEAPAGPPRVRQSPKPMYRAPNGYEWTGRGALPRVFKELGVTDKKGMEQYLIKNKE